MRSFTLAERRARLARRHFLSPNRPADLITGTAATLVGLHATDPATPYLSRWARLPGVTVADLEAEPYQRRTLVKLLAMRRTLWMVRTEDLPLIHEMARNMLADTMIGPLEPQVYGYRLSRHVTFESWCERDDLIGLDFDPTVCGFGYPAGRPASHPAPGDRSTDPASCSGASSKLDRCAAA